MPEPATTPNQLLFCLARGDKVLSKSGERKELFSPRQNAKRHLQKERPFPIRRLKPDGYVVLRDKTPSSVFHLDRLALLSGMRRGVKVEIFIFFERDSAPRQSNKKSKYDLDASTIGRK